MNNNNIIYALSDMFILLVIGMTFFFLINGISRNKVKRDIIKQLDKIEMKLDSIEQKVSKRGT